MLLYSKSTPTIVYKEGKKINPASALQLYNDAGWTVYTKKPEILEEAIQKSLWVLSAWDNNTLVGLLRIVGDGLTIIYIQDILILKKYKRRKIGTTLVGKALEKYEHVRQKVLLADDNPESRAFYESLGFESCDKGKVVAFAKFH